MNEGWRQVFAPHPAPPWLEALDQEPVKALDALLRHRFYLGNLQLADADELLIDGLELLEDVGFPAQLDGAIAEWITWRWGDLAISRSTELVADTWAQLLAVVSYANELSRAGAALGERLAEAHDFLGPLSGSPSRDPLGLYLAALANHQGDRRWAPFWWWMCELPAAVPAYHAVYAIAGLRGLPAEPGEPGGGFRHDVARAIVLLARSFYRLAEEGALARKDAKETFRDVALLTYSAYPFPSRWVETLGAELRRIDEPVGPWLESLIPGGSPELQSIIRQRRTSPPHDRSPTPHRPETWASRAQAIAKVLPRCRDRDLADVVELLDEQRRHAEQWGDSELLVKSLCNFANQRIRARWRLDRATAWADQARAWAPTNPYAWTTLGHALEATEQLEAAEGVYRETVERFPQNVVARAGLGEVLKAKGELEAAEGVYRETVGLFPRDSYAREGHARIRRLRLERGELAPEADDAPAVAPDGQSYPPGRAPASMVRDPSMAGRDASTVLGRPAAPPADPVAPWARSGDGRGGEPPPLIDGPLAAPLDGPLVAPALPAGGATLSHGHRQRAVGRARLYRWLARSCADPSRVETLRLRAEQILDQLLELVPGNPEALAERAHHPRAESGLRPCRARAARRAGGHPRARLAATGGALRARASGLGPGEARRSHAVSGSDPSSIANSSASLPSW